MTKKTFFLIVGIAAVLLAVSAPAFAVFYGSPKLGFQPIETDRYGAAYFAPENYTSEKDWPLVVILYSDEAEKGSVFCERWLPELKKHNAIGLFVSYLEPRESPFSSDKRLLRLVREIKRMFSIDPNRVLLTAFGGAAHYAFYVGFSYPEQFSYAALAAGGAEGLFEPFLKHDRSNAAQLPFLIVFGDRDETIHKETFIPVHEKFHNRGYDIELEEFGGLGHRMSPEFQARIMEWFGAKAIARDLSAEKVVAAEERFEPVVYGIPRFISSLIRGILKG